MELKQVIFWLLLIGFVCGLVVVLTIFGKSISYSIFYEDMVKQTVEEMMCQMVHEQAVKELYCQ